MGKAYAHLRLRRRFRRERHATIQSGRRCGSQGGCTDGLRRGCWRAHAIGCGLGVGAMGGIGVLDAYPGACGHLLTTPGMCNPFFSLVPLRSTNTSFDRKRPRLARPRAVEVFAYVHVSLGRRWKFSLYGISMSISLSNLFSFGAVLS